MAVVNDAAGKYSGAGLKLNKYLIKRPNYFLNTKRTSSSAKIY